MKRRSIIKAALLAILLAGVVGLLETTAFGQCSMCRASLAGSGNASFIKQFNLGVLILLVPPVAMFCSIFVILRRHRGNDATESQHDNVSE